ncbi:aminoacylase [Fistulifera solaris]|uniref:N-acyl-aliphatic-L-amino acid amidohydrolase n=1 Tax=Fistulifera solaris TaxID=1519565 RepID=A0A1Z5KKG7_FISSO|nr:aminoacylase [Fistulifera solaris]|eukprot:GAX26615.1 aminoacylase [Fistulifera solaris]
MSTDKLAADAKEAAIQSFVEFIRFPTVSSTGPETGSYRNCANWLKDRLHFLDEVFFLEDAPDHSPVVVARWKGRDETLPVLLLNSHYDVVPAEASDWSVPPFEGLRKERMGSPVIYGRGTQDMKCVCIQYIEAVAHLKAEGFQPARDVYLTFVPDEEIGGSGMAAFLDSSLYKSLPGIALALDEGLASTTDVFSVFYGERLPWWVEVTARGPTGHGSRFIENTAVGQLLEFAQKAMEFRSGQRSLLGLDEHSNCAHAAAKKTLGDVTSLNITTLQAGVKAGNSYAYNCVPPVASCSLDIRISPHMDPQSMGSLLDKWCLECGTVEWNYIGGQGNQSTTHAVTSTVSNPWYDVFASSLQRTGYQVETSVFPAATDSRFLRALGIRALGFSPMRNTEIKLHEVDEYIPEHTFLEGIEVFIGLLRDLMSQGKEMEEKIMESP